ncbi:MAG: A/G-specific adenine glycosylase [Acidobacteria bacterium]|nr:A/G-specific adenine glycosylase [Acidobacteriota bacterium]
MPNMDLPSEQAADFRRTLARWYKQHARSLPWRETRDPYRIWVSEVMLQQTRVNAVLEHYARFLRKFPTIVSLALAPEADVLAVWSGLGYYRRARMLHKAAQFITAELDGVLPSTSAELRKLPGIGEYTSAAIASIAFGESIAVVDGNVERVLLRLTGRPEQTTSESKRFVADQAAALVPQRRSGTNAPGDHNQAMMELGATICLPKGPLCLQCPVYDFCRTRGEHKTEAREKMRSRRVAYLLHQRKRDSAIEVMLHHRPTDASLMPGMYELPELPMDGVEEHTPTLRVRHSITNTNYYVEVFTADKTLLRALPLSIREYEWCRLGQLADLPLTGLARKVLRRLHLIASPGVRMPQPETMMHQKR